MNEQSPNGSREERLDEIIAEFMEAEDAWGRQHEPEWIAKYPEFADDLGRFFANREALGFAPPPIEQSGQSGPPLIPFTAEGEPLRVGSVFAGQYRISGVKDGGMGRVYFADVLSTNVADATGKVAIKTIPDLEEWQERQRTRGRPDHKAGYHLLAARFRQEAQTWVQIGKHPNVLWAFFVLDVGGKPYLVMEYAEDGDLASWISAGRITLPIAVNLAIQFCRGMTQTADACGIVHRDIKPANVLLTRGHLLKVSDFGLSKAFDRSETSTGGASGDNSPLSQTGAGTWSYMAPEQFLSLAKADTRSDIYSFGAMLYEMLSREQLFTAHTEIEHRLARTKPLPQLLALPSEVPAECSLMLARCLAVDPGDRYQSFRELEVELLQVHNELPAPIPIPADAATISDDLLIQNIASSMLSLGLFEAASNHAEEGIRRFPKSAGHWINRGTALANLDRIRESLECHTRATELSPANALAWANLGSARLQLNDPEGGLQAAMSAVRLDDELAEAWWARGQCERELGRISKAILSLRRAIQVRPHDWRGHFFLAQTLFRTARFSEAIDSLRTTVHQNRHNAEAWRLLAVAFNESNCPGEARQAIDRAIEIDAQSSDAWIIRAVILSYFARESANVEDCFARATKLDPLNPRIDMMRNRIRMTAVAERIGRQ